MADNADRYRTFVDKVVQGFGRQAEEGKHEFAVIILAPNDDINNMAFIPSDGYGRPETDSSVDVWPPVERLVNYIVSRPNSLGRGDDNKEHAEYQALKNFAHLMANFKQSYGNQDPKEIILYSWMFPCYACVPEITKIAQEETAPKHIPRTLLYSTQGLGYEELNEEAKQKCQAKNSQYIASLREAGIHTKRVQYFNHPNGPRR